MPTNVPDPELPIWGDMVFFQALNGPDKYITHFQIKNLWYLRLQVIQDIRYWKFNPISFISVSPYLN